MQQVRIHYAHTLQAKGSNGALLTVEFHRRALLNISRKKLEVDDHCEMLVAVYGNTGSEVCGRRAASQHHTLAAFSDSQSFTSGSPVNV